MIMWKKKIESSLIPKLLEDADSGIRLHKCCHLAQAVERISHRARTIFGVNL